MCYCHLFHTILEELLIEGVKFRRIVLQEKVTSIDPVRIIGLQLSNDFRIKAQPMGQEGELVPSHGIRLFYS